ncbi:MAG: peptidylprolyl isomerase [Bacteroidota bacterium]|nr:peptidylprolyl isomerase [Candidatus Kapabacteria bacterium]MDW8218935.1 peptidylprolyl isomerase [Bacteroidota bacterium]
MRNISPYVLIAVAVMFVAFMVISDLDLPTIANRGQNLATAVLGTVNGEKIMYVDFERRFKEQVEAARAQSPNVEDFDEAPIREQVWNEMVDEILLRQQAEKLGISVSNEEILDVLLENPPDFLRRPFTDSTGRFLRDVYLEYVTNPDIITQRAQQQGNQDAIRQAEKQAAEFKKYLVRVEDALRQDKLQNNMKAAVGAAYGALDSVYLQRKYSVDNSTIDADIVALNANIISDTAVAVSDSEIERYYRAHESSFKQKSVRKLRYALIPVVPSSADTQRVQKRLERITTDLNVAQTPGQRDTVFERYIGDFGGQVHDFKFVQDIPPQTLVMLNSLPLRGVVGPIQMPQGTTFIRLDERRSGANVMTKASHILIRFVQNNQASKDSAKAIAEQLFREASSGADFAELARKNSQDPGSAQNGGDLGFFGKGMMVKPFEDAAMNAAVGSIVGPVETQFGWHIIKVTDRKTDEIKYSEIVLTPTVSQATRNQLYRTAIALKQSLESGVPFDTATKRLGIAAYETAYFRRIATILGSRTLTNFAFESNVGDVCDPIELKNTGIVVAQLAQSRLAGIKPLEDAKDEIRNKLLVGKKLDVLKGKAQELFAKLATLDSLAKARTIDSTLNVISSQGITDNGRVPSLGSDVGLTAALFMQEPSCVGKIIGPIRGERAYYIVQVKARKNADPNGFAAARSTLAQSVKSKAEGTIYFKWRNELRERADITDNRTKYFRD